jgi:hypothetical protein
MAHPSHPTQGARFQLTRQSATPDQATYKVEIHEADALHTACVTINKENKDAQWDAFVSEPADVAVQEWQQRHAEALLRQCSQQARSKGSWPRRLRRWRETK